MMPSPNKGELLFTVDIWSWNPFSVGGINHQFFPPSVEIETAPPSQLASVHTQLLNVKRAVELAGTMYSGV